MQCHDIMVQNEENIMRGEHICWTTEESCIFQWKWEWDGILIGVDWLWSLFTEILPRGSDIGILATVDIQKWRPCLHHEERCLKIWKTYTPTVTKNK